MYAEIQRSLLTVNGVDKVVLYMVPFRSPEDMETGVDDAVPPYRLIPGGPRPSVGSLNSLVVTNYGVGLLGGDLHFPLGPSTDRILGGAVQQQSVPGQGPGLSRLQVSVDQTGGRVQ